MTHASPDGKPDAILTYRPYPIYYPVYLLGNILTVDVPPGPQECL